MTTGGGTPQAVYPPRYIVWSVERPLNLSDPFQRKWYVRQVLLHGRSEDIRHLDLEMVASLLDDLHLPPPLHRLWKQFLGKHRHVAR